MGLFTRLLAADDGPNPTASPFDDWWYKSIGTASASGIRITPDMALQVSAVFACVKVLAETMGILPMPVYERVSPSEKRRAYEQPEYQLLNVAPNQWQSPFEFRENLTAWAALHGDGYAIKIFDGPVIVELDPVHPLLVRVEKLPTRRLRYWIRQSDGTEKPYTQGEVFHVRGFSVDGLSGVKLSTMAREAIGLARAMEAFGSRYFANDTTIGMVLEHPGTLGEEAHKRLKDSFSANYGGVNNAFKPKVLEEGMKLNRIQAIAKDAQLTEGRLHQVIEICRFFRMQPHKIAHLIQATFSNIEHQAIEHVTDTIQPWAVRWEEAVTRDIIVDNVTYFAEFLLAALLRGDSASRGAYLQMRIQNGTLSRNEWRALENENPIPGGDTYYVNASLIPLDENGRPIPTERVTVNTPPTDTPANTPDPADTEDDSQESPNGLALARASFRVLLADAAERIANAEARELGKRVEKVAEDHERFVRWAAEEVYAGHQAYAERTLTPIVSAWAVLGIQYVDAASLAASIVAQGKQDIASSRFRTDPTSVIAGRHANVARLIASAFNLEGNAHVA